MKPETNPKKTKAKKKGTNSTHYLIHVYEDKEMLKHIKSIANVPQDKTKAHKLFKSVIIDDTTLNKYYYYELVEQTFKSVELYPTPAQQ
jgi:hypothetical protein